MFKKVNMPVFMVIYSFSLPRCIENSNGPTHGSIKEDKRKTSQKNKTKQKTPALQEYFHCNRGEGSADANQVK